MMVCVYSQETRLNFKTIYCDATLTENDVVYFEFNYLMARQARKWIEGQGYHIKIYGNCVRISLERFAFTIINVYSDYGCPPIDNLCYAAVLLYQRLKRNGAIQ